jgi:amino acid transporter
LRFSFLSLDHSRLIRRGSWILHGDLLWDGSTCIQRDNRRGKLNPQAYKSCSYAIQWLVVLPLEIVAASITLSFWPGAADTNAAAWVTIFLVVIICINFFGVRGYGEAEFVFAIIKVIAVIGFIILGIILNCGGGPEGGYIGGRYWESNNVPASYAGYTQDGQPPGSITSGAFNSGFKGLCSVFVTAAFSFAGTEVSATL